jgi:hypothetical protein
MNDQQFIITIGKIPSTKSGRTRSNDEPKVILWAIIIMSAIIWTAAQGC